MNLIYHEKINNNNNNKNYYYYYYYNYNHNERENSIYTQVFQNFKIHSISYSTNL